MLEPLKRHYHERLSSLRAGITRNHCGLEIGPWINPVFKKKDGYSVEIVDVLDTDELVKKCHDKAELKNFVANIEDVDYIFNISLLNTILESKGEVSGIYDFICSSHNFEHLPNPIAFLKDCEILLKEGGVLTMAIPIGSRCFDRMRPLSTVGQWIDAYRNNQRQPSVGQIIDYRLNFSNNKSLASPDLVFAKKSFRWNPQYLKSVIELDETGVYTDIHCWVFNISSFQLLLADLQNLGIVKHLFIEEIVSIEDGIEFIVRLRKKSSVQPPEDRAIMLRAVLDEWLREVVKFSDDYD